MQATATGVGTSGECGLNYNYIICIGGFFWRVCSLLFAHQVTFFIANSSQLPLHLRLLRVKFRLLGSRKLRHRSRYKSTTGECGPLFADNKTCTGTQFGVCCSTSGFCGNSTDYCGVGNCYDGACDTESSSSSSSLTSIISSSSKNSSVAGTTITTSVTPLAATQTAIIASCDKYYVVVSGQSYNGIFV